MKHKRLLLILLILLLCALGGSVLLGLHLPTDRPSGDAASGGQELSPFHSINLDVKSADVIIETGDTYAIQYSLHPKEPVTQLEVVNDTLRFDTGFDTSWKPGRGHWSIVITVPQGTVFDSLELKSTAGDILLSGYSFRDGTFKTTSGEIQLEGLTCESLFAKSVSDDITLKDSTVSRKAILDTVSGDIEVLAPFASIEAKSVGGIELNGADQGRRLSVGQGQPSLSAESVSGKIEIETPPVSAAEESL